MDDDYWTCFYYSGYSCICRSYISSIDYFLINKQKTECN